MKPILDWLIDVPSMDDNTSGGYPCILIITQVNTNKFLVEFILTNEWRRRDHPCPIDYVLP